MKADDFHLQRLIFIDSFKSSDIVEVALDGHTNLNGHNGAGKTTLLRLVPLFYGEASSKILRGEHSKKSFTDYYLPRSTSYIVFEYIRRGQPSLAVMHASSSGEGVEYRFVGDGFSRALFVEGGPALVQCGNLLRHISKLGKECTKTLSRKDYRAIIQNTVDRRELRPFVARYGFAGGIHRLTNIEKIVTGMFVRHTTFRELRQMIVSCITEDTGRVEIGARKEEMQVWSREFDAYNHAMQESDRFAAIERNSAERARTLADLSRMKGFLDRLANTLDDQGKALAALIKDAGDKQIAARTKAQTEIGEVRGKYVAEETKERLARESRSALEARHEAYRKERIEEKVGLVDSLPSLRQEGLRLNKDHKALIGTSTSITEKYEALKKSEQEAATSRIAVIADRKDPVRQQTAQQMELTNQAYEARQEGQRNAAANERQSLNGDLEDLAAQIARLDYQVEHTQASPELVIQEEAKSDAVEKARMALEALRHTTAQAEKEAREAQRQFEEAEAEERRAHQRVEDLKDEYGRIQALAEAGPDTFIGWLRTARPTWMRDIARLVPSEILMRKDLDPALDPDAGNALYGVQIDLDRIEPPDLADELLLVQRMEDLQARIQRAEEKRQADQDAMEARAKILAGKKGEAEQLGKQLEAKNREYSTQLSELASLRKLVAQSLAERRKNAKVLLEEEQAKQRAKKAELEQLESRLTNELRGLQEELEAARGAIKTNESNAIAQIEAEIRTERDGLLTRIADLDAERKHSLQEAGVDTGTLTRLENELNKLKETATAAEEAQATVAQYKVWLEESWATLPVRQNEQKAAAAEKQKLAATIQQREASLQAELAGLIQQIEGYQKDRDKLLEDLNTARRRLDGMSNIPIDAEAANRPHDSAHTLTFLAGQINTLTSALKKLNTTIKEETAIAIRAFTAFRGSFPDRLYERYRNELTTAEYDNEQWISVLRQWFSEEHQHARSVLLGQASLLGQSVSSFRNAIKKFRDNARGFSNELQACIDSSADFDRISSIHARVTSSIDELDYWRAISDFSNEFEIWAQRGEQGLPHAEFNASLRKVAECFQGEKGLDADLVDLIQLEIDLVENGRAVTVRDEQQLEHVSSNGLSYLILVVLFIGFLSRIRRDAPVQVVCSVDELKNIDLPNTERLFGLLDRHRITLISAFPDADPEVLRLFRHRYTILEGRALASVALEDDMLEGVANVGAAVSHVGATTFEAASEAFSSEDLGNV